MALIAFFYFIPSIAIAVICIALIADIEKRGYPVSKVIFEAIGMALFWPGALLYVYYKQQGDRISWLLVLLGAFFYLGFVSAELAHEDKELWIY